MIPRVKPYEDAPRLPGAGSAAGGAARSEAERVDVREIVRGAFVEIELGSGRGGFLVERAAAAPDAALVGLEIRRKWASIVDARLAKLGLASRARVFAEDARVALPRLWPDASVRRFFAHFPDPWWKKRHQKRIMLAPAVLDQIARLLEPGGELFVQTDVEERAVQLETRLGADARFRPFGDAPGSARLADNPDGARSPRERRATADGLPVFRLRFTRV
jgi:tRNA (guanine-N7-)-methyltransferase